MRLVRTNADGSKVYHYSGVSVPAPGYPGGVPAGFVRVVAKDGAVVEDRPQRFEDVAGNGSYRRLGR